MVMIYAGIDEAGYGPMFGPLTIGRAVFAVDVDEAGQGKAVGEGCGTSPFTAPALWDLLREGVCRELSGRRGRIAVNDSKKLRTAAAGISHLERGVLAFLSLAHQTPSHVGALLDQLGESSHHTLEHLPWYCASCEVPWQALPCSCTAGEVAVARGMLSTVASKAGVHVPDMGAAIVFEDRFNDMVGRTRSKAATSFTFVAGHLQKIWQQFGGQNPFVVVDRQSGRMHYRELLSMTFPQAAIRVMDENSACSAYELHAMEKVSGRIRSRSMRVQFEVNADAKHMPVALASMTAKYVREVMMERFNNWFCGKVPELKPTAGYATDGKRFWQDIQPQLQSLNINGAVLKRIS